MEKSVLPFDTIASLLDPQGHSWLIIAPLGLLGVIFVAWVVLVLAKRLRERDEIGEAMRLEVHTSEERSSASLTPSQAWLARLRGGLSAARASLGDSLRDLLNGRRSVDPQVLESLAATLHRADFGPTTTTKLIRHVEESLRGIEAASAEDLRSAIAQGVASILEPVETPLVIPETKPWVVLIVGVNGVGKTTTVGKLAAHFQSEGRRSLLGAADTFRAAAAEQLQVWGDRVHLPVVLHQAGSDPAAVAFDSVRAAKHQGLDVCIIDTAGRLHNKADLMQELTKIRRVVGRELEGAPHETWLVLDATTGQNAHQQVRLFREAAQVTGLVVTKLDGTAKGGFLVGIADEFKIPVRFIGVGEQAEDLRPFRSADFVSALLRDT